jgi:hypothetical protein
VTLILKRSTAQKLHTRIDLALGPAGYRVTNSGPVAKPPVDAIWLEDHPRGFSEPGHTLLQRARGGVSVIVAGADVNTAADFLTLVYANLARLQASLSSVESGVLIEKPKIQVRTEAPSEVDVTRFLVKTGFNLLAHMSGAAVCRDARFDALCSFVRTGAPHMQFALWPEGDGLAPLLRSQFLGRHWMLLAPIPSPGDPLGRLGIAFACSLYGGPARLVLLSDDIPDELHDAHRIVAVDYVNRRVEAFNLMQFMAAVRHRAASREPDPRA